MNTQELWQSQALDAPRVSLGYVQHRARNLQRRTQIRNGSEYLLAALGLPYIAWTAWKHVAHMPLALSGKVLLMLAALYIMFRWHQLASAAKISTNAGVLSSLDSYWRELIRQRDARRLQREIDALDSLTASDKVR